MSRLPFELFLALRYLRPKRTFVSVITLISVIGVALGVAVLIIVISVMSGYDHDLREQIIGFRPHLSVYQFDHTLRDYAAVAERIAKMENVRTVSPFVLGPVLLQTQGGTNRPSYQDVPMLRGMDPDEEGKASQLTNRLIAGTFDLSGRGMVVGSDLASRLHLQVGDSVSIYSSPMIEKIRQSYEHKEDTVIPPVDYEIRGIYDTGYYEYDSRFIIASIESAQDLYDLDDAVHGLTVMLKNPEQAAAAKTQIMRLLGPGYEVQTWMDQDAAILNALVVEKSMMFYLLFFIVLVAALCILSAQITFVVQKTREIGMLKALGASHLQISGIFLAQSAIIGVIGVAAGLALGLLAVTYRNPFLHTMNQLTGRDLFPASVYGFGGLPALIVPHDVMVICLGSFILCLLGGVLPAFRAGRLKPVEALRYE